MKNFNTSISRRSLIASAFAGLGVVALGGLTACGGSSTAAEGSTSADSTTLTVAASPTPHAEILNDFAAPLLAEQGIELKVPPPPGGYSSGRASGSQTEQRPGLPVFLLPSSTAA